MSEAERVAAESEIGEIYNFLPITDSLATGGQPTTEQLEALSTAGYGVVINLAMPSHPRALPNEGALVEALGMRYVPIPVVWEAPTAEDLTQVLDALDACVGQKCFVHCMANLRVAAFVFLHRVLRQGMPVAAAEVDLQRIWQPNEVWAAYIAAALAGREG